jgi:hypothetical protein
VATQALTESKGSKQCVVDAKHGGEDWAMSVKMGSVVAYLTHLDNSAALLADPENNWLLDSYTKAMSRPDRWEEPIEQEIKNLSDHHVWTLVDWPAGIKPMQNCWTFVNKYNADGALVGRKAHLVAKGFTQIPGG